MSAAMRSSGVGNESARQQPVADGGLVAVVELEDVDRPVTGSRQVGAQMRLGDVVEVLVPGAPADLVRSRDPRDRAVARPRRPGAERLARVAGDDPEVVEVPPLPGAELGAAEERLGHDLAVGHAERAVVARAAVEADADGAAVAVGEHRHQLAARRAGRHGIAVGVERGPERPGWCRRTE